MRPHETTVRAPGRTSALSAGVVAALVVALLVPCALPAAPSSSSVAADRASVERAVAARSRAEARLATIEAKVAAASKRLDRLMVEQRKAQDRLDSHAVSTYRAGHAEFIEILTGSTDFQDFANRWFLLTRIGRSDAAAIADLKAARKRSVASARELAALQSRASAELRGVVNAEAAARKELAGSQAAYEEYQRRAAAAASAAKASARTASAKKSEPEPTPQDDQNQSGSGEWKTAVASHYGLNFHGRGASGERIGPDSMIVAHKTLPFGTLIEFEYNGKRAVAHVADRGPFVAGRTFDLGPGVIRVLGFRGVHRVRYRIIGN